LINDGYRWRRLSPVKLYVNTMANVLKRSAFAKKMIALLEKKTKIINVDESGFNMTSSFRQGWVVKGSQARSMRFQKIPNMTLISAITFSGRNYYSLLLGSNNEFVFCRYLTMLSDRLDKDDPDWRKTSVVLMDNSAIHGTQDVLQRIKDLQMPVIWSAPASYEAICIELHFAHVKKKFSKIYIQNREKCFKTHGSIPRGRQTDLVANSIA
jgi:hypothetical protein